MIAHPLAKNWTEAGGGLADGDVGRTGNTTRACPAARLPTPLKYLAGEAGFQACEQAVTTMAALDTRRNSMSSAICARSTDPRIAPISPQLALSFVAEKVLGLPKSY
mgnify:CR=1 FL=1